MESKNMIQTDWELTEDYYQNAQDAPELKLEDFMDEDGSSVSSLKELQIAQKTRLDQITKDVHQVLALAKEGKTVDEIAAKLGMNPQYVYDIQVSAQGFREDDEIAVAHLVGMSAEG